MSFDGFIVIPKIPGEAQEVANGMRMMSYNTGITQSATVTKSGTTGLGEGNADFNDFTFSKVMDKSTPKLNLYAATGEHLGDCTVTLLRPGGEAGKVEYMKYILTNCFLTNVTTNGGGSENPTESVSIGFEEIEWIYQSQESLGGSGEGPDPMKFSLVKGKKC